MTEQMTKKVGRPRSRVQKQCAYCGSDFEVPACRAETARFCSIQCNGKGRIGQPGTKGNPTGLRGVHRNAQPKADVTCRNCEKVFTVLYKQRNRVYCSRACFAEGLVGLKRASTRTLTKVCAACQSEFIVYTSNAGQVCCSRECAGSLRRTRPGRSRPLRDMSEAEVAWFAGLFDGEGTIVLANRSQPKPAYRIAIGMTDLSVLERVQAVVGVGSIHEQPAKRSPYHSTAYTWTAFGRNALDLIGRMRPWLIVKAERADAALDGRFFPRSPQMERLYGREADVDVP